MLLYLNTQVSNLPTLSTSHIAESEKSFICLPTLPSLHTSNNLFFSIISISKPAISSLVLQTGGGA